MRFHSIRPKAMMIAMMSVASLNDRRVPVAPYGERLHIPGWPAPRLASARAGRPEGRS
jgi:hypothetical protein